MDKTSPQRKKLPPYPSLEHLQKQAKDRARKSPSLKLAAAQHLIAQEYGFKNWAILADAVRKLSGEPGKSRPVVCEKCGVREATVHLSFVADGKETNEHLCSECAPVPHLPEELVVFTPPKAAITASAAYRQTGLSRLLAALGDLFRGKNLHAQNQSRDKFQALLKWKWLELTPDQQAEATLLWNRTENDLGNVRSDKDAPPERKRQDTRQLQSQILEEFTLLLSEKQQKRFIRQRQFSPFPPRVWTPASITAAIERRIIATELEIAPEDSEDTLRTTLAYAKVLLSKKREVTLRLSLSGGEIAQSDAGFVFLKSAVATLKDVSDPKGAARLVGQNIIVHLVPKHPPDRPRSSER